jgi:hypothetical protein
MGPARRGRRAFAAAGPFGSLAVVVATACGTWSGLADAPARDAPQSSTLTPDLVWYVLDETTGTIAHDSSPHHYDMGLAGVTWDHGALFAGANSCGFRSVPADRTPPLTMTIWLTPSARHDGTINQFALWPFPANAFSSDIPGIGGYAIGINVWTDGNGGSDLAVEGADTCMQAGLCVANSNQSGHGFSSASCSGLDACNAGFVAGREYFVAVAIAAPVGDPALGVPAQVYVDGALFDDTTAYVAARNPAAPLYLGCCNFDPGYGSKRSFLGRIRDARIYSRQLTAAEVGQLYAAGPAVAAPR